MRCPYCDHPLRDQAKFCNNCGATMPAGGASSVVAPAPPMPPEERAPSPASPAQPIMSIETLPGKASPTGPMRPASAAPTNGASQAPEQPEAGASSPQATANEALAPPTSPPGAMGDDMTPAEQAADQPGALEDWEEAQDLPGQQSAPPVPTEALYGLDPYAPVSDQPALEVSAEMNEEHPPDDELPTIHLSRPDKSDVEVTPDLLGALGNEAPLQPGMLLEGRYRVEEVVHTSQEENLYRVTDEMGYLHCWACNADFPATTEPERYCSNCGADMLEKEYWLRERTQAAVEAEAEQAADTGEVGQALAEAGTVPGANGAHPEGPANAALVADALSEHSADADGEEQDWPTQPMTAIASFIVGPRQYRVEALEIEDPVFPLGVTLVAGARSDVGRTRRGNPNEDSILIMEFTRVHESITQPFGLYIVADGLGGHDDGQAASRKAVAVIADSITREVLIPAIQSGQFADGETLAARLKGAVEAANLALVASNEQTGSDMGSTVTGALIVGDTAHIVNVGDSRTYLYDTNSLQPITIDHSLVMQLVIGGLIDHDDIYTHPQRNQILRSLGDRRDVQIDQFTQKLRPGYQLLICCDGLWEMVRDPQIEQVLREVSDPQSAADKLVELANQNGGEDNISAIIVQARE
jgi:serine/threonine protein phosphatase PrpC